MGFVGFGAGCLLCEFSIGLVLLGWFGFARLVWVLIVLVLVLNVFSTCGLLCILTKREACVAGFSLLYFVGCLFRVILIVINLALWAVYSLVYLFKLLLLLYLLILCFGFVLVD